MYLTDQERKVVEERGISFDMYNNAVLKTGKFVDGGSWFLMLSANDGGKRKQYFTMKIFIKNKDGAQMVKTICNRVSLFAALEKAETY